MRNNNKKNSYKIIKLVQMSSYVSTFKTEKIKPKILLKKFKIL